jgi:hypothetical protein
MSTVSDTTPGRFTATVGTRLLVVLTAIVAVSGLATTAAFGAGEPNADAPGGTTGQAPAGEAAVRGILPYIPTEHRYSCVATDPAAAGLDEVKAATASIDAALVCSPGGAVRSVNYYEFSDQASMQAAYNALVSNLTASDDPNCAADHGWSYGDDTHGGRLVCFITTLGQASRIEPTAVLVWTADARNLLGYAYTNAGDADAAALTAWWDDDAGPTQDHDDTGIASPSNRPTEQRDQQLLRVIPATTRSSCAAKDRSDPDAYDGGLYDSRYFVEAVVVCKDVAPSVDEVTYSYVSPKAIEQFAVAKYGFDDASAAELDEAEQCPHQATYSSGTGKQKRRLGSYTCYFLDNDDGSQRAIFRWTDTKLGVLGVAVNNEGDATALEKWWSSKKSGPLRTSTG